MNNLCEFSAKGSRQLDICLRMLYDAGYEFFVKIVKNEKDKIEYRISIVADEEAYQTLSKRFRNLIM